MPKTLGEHLLKRRMELGLTQVQVSFQLHTDEYTVGNWEKDRTAPAVRFFPAILAFLAYDPFPKPTSLGERITRKRRELGLSIKDAAKLIGVDEGTFGHWEKGTRNPTRGKGALDGFLAIRDKGYDDFSKGRSS